MDAGVTRRSSGSALWSSSRAAGASRRSLPTSLSASRRSVRGDVRHVSTEGSKPGPPRRRAHERQRVRTDGVDMDRRRRCRAGRRRPSRDRDVVPQQLRLPRPGAGVDWGQALGPGRLAVDARLLERDPAQVVPPEAGAVTIIGVLHGDMRRTARTSTGRWRTVRPEPPVHARRIPIARARHERQATATARGLPTTARHRVELLGAGP
jgi:hypothetical protein